MSWGAATPREVPDSITEDANDSRSWASGEVWYMYDTLCHGDDYSRVGAEYEALHCECEVCGYIQESGTTGERASRSGDVYGAAVYVECSRLSEYSSCCSSEYGACCLTALSIYMDDSAL